MRQNRLGPEKQARLIDYVGAETTARTAADLVGVNKSTAAYYFLRLLSRLRLGFSKFSHNG